MSIMDDSDIYVNVEKPWGNLESSKHCRQRSGDVYENFNQEITTRHAGFSVTAAGGLEERSGGRLCRGAAVFLALLCFLLLVGLTTVVFLYTHNQAEYEKQRALLAAVNANQTSERDQFLELERRTEQLQQRLDAVSKNHSGLLEMLQDSAARLRNLMEERATMKSFLNYGWVYFGGNFYHVSTTKKSWDESRRDCQQKGANLLIINSREEQVFANQFKKYMWIGMTDVASEGVWKWVDGTKVSTSYWIPGEPNGGRDENCGHIKDYGQEQWWNDESCTDYLFWICEKKFLQ